MAVTQALAEPAGGQVVKGQAQINQTGASGATTTTIKQSTPQVSINWQSFNVGEKERVNFIQPDASSLAINRVVSSQGSNILGKIDANGQIWLINPNGIMFGKNAQVNVGGLVASTLDTANPGSLTGWQRFTGSSTAAVTNNGLLNAADGGYVALLGHRLSNHGTIQADAGAVAMGAGNSVDLQFNQNQLLGVQVYESLLDAMSENSGVIGADAGQVLLKAGAQGSLLRSVVNNTGVIQARTVQKQGGKIVLLSGMKAGITRVDGKLDASVTDAGDGGFIETSGQTVQLGDKATITTQSAHGKQGEWLIDPDDFVVAASGGNMTGSQLSRALNSSGVTIETTNGPAKLNGAISGVQNNGAGDIQINDPVTWSGNTLLTLKAYRNININAPVSASGTYGRLDLKYGMGSPDGVINGSQSIYTINAPVSLQPGNTFSTQMGSTGPFYLYTVITGLGAANDWRLSSSATNSLQAIARRSNLTGYYALGADIDAHLTTNWNGILGFTPIGGNAGNMFTGSFEGLGHKIANLNINNSSRSYLGLFGLTGVGSSISNLRLTSTNVYGNQQWVGGLVGMSQGSIYNVSVDGLVMGISKTGGVVGEMVSGKLDKSTFSGPVTGNFEVGGIAGHVSAISSIDHSAFSGVLTGDAQLGGLAGTNTGLIQNSQASVSFLHLNNAFYSVGGLVGENAGTLRGNYVNVSMDSLDGTSIAGLAGTNLLGGLIENNYAKGSINAYDGVAGLTSLNQGDARHNYIQMRLTASTGNMNPLTGPNSSGGLLENYYDKSMLRSSSFFGGGLTASQMLNASSFVGFDFNNFWFNYDAHTTPLLRSFLTPLNVTVSISGNKTYDGGTACVTVLCQYSVDPFSLVAGKQLLGTGLVLLSNKNAGAVTGRFSGLYSDQQGYLINTIYTGIANIDKADLTVTATAVRKTYDGTTAASGAGSVGAIAGAGAGETVKTAGSQVFLDKNAGSGKTVRASGVSIQDSGNADVSGNYNITYVDNTASQIDKADLTVTATAVRKTYDGTTAASGAGSVGTIAGAGAGETVKTAGSQVFLDKNAGGGKTVRASGVSIQDSGNADVSGNYNITYVDNFAGSIEQILAETVVSSPAIQVQAVTAQAFKFAPWTLSKPLSSAEASSPILVLPEGLQKSLDLPLFDHVEPVDSNAENTNER